MDSEIRINTDQLSIESGVVNFRERNSVLNCRLPEPFISIIDDVCCVEKYWLRES